MMPITWRPAAWADIEPSLSIQPKKLGDAVVGIRAAIDCWKHLVRDRFFASAVIESTPSIRGHRILGLGCSIVVSTAFADAEIANPRPDINSRVMASIASGKSVVATRDEVARANADGGVDVVVLYGNWRENTLSAGETQEVQSLFAISFTERHTGWRIRNILYESCDERTREFVERSVVYKAIADFPELGRVIHLMTRESVMTLQGSLGHILFSYREPVLRLRDSDQELLLAALDGATDLELAAALGVTFAAVKARWRSTFARIATAKPELMGDVDDHEGRGAQKRHRVLAYMRTHPEELRPYDWKAGNRVGSHPG